MKTEYYWIKGPWKGRLAIVPRPRGGDWLEDEIHSWHEAGLEITVSLLTPPEIEEFDLDPEEELARAQDIEFIPSPIPDRGIPRRAKRPAPYADWIVCATSLSLSRRHLGVDRAAEANKGPAVFGELFGNGERMRCDY